MSILTAAMEYADRGWNVFTLTGGKTPFRNCDPCRELHLAPDQMETCQCLHCHGFYAATTDPDRIRAMIDRPGGMCLAVRTGEVSGLAVVDVDIKTWREDGWPSTSDPGYLTMSGLDERRLLPGTLMQSTGSGGLHFLYAHPGGYLMSGAGKYGPQVDSKADGAYIVVAPSVSRSGPYTWTGDGRFDHPLTPLPEELAAMVRPPEMPARRSQVSPWTRPGVPVGRLTALVRVVLEAVDGERNDKLHWAAKVAGEMIAAGDVEETVVVDVLTDAGRAVGLTANEIGDATRGTIASGLRKGRVAA